MKKKYLRIAGQTLTFIGEFRLQPRGNVIEWPASLESEDPRWLRYINDEVVVDAGLKLSFQTDDATKAAALAHQERVMARGARRGFGGTIKDEIAEINESKVWTVPQFLAYSQDPIVQQMSTLLGDGYIETARDLMLASDVSAYYTTDEKNYVIGLMNDWLTNN